MWFLSLTPCLGWSARCGSTELLSKVEWNRKLVCRAQWRDASGTLLTLASCGIKLHWGSAGAWMQNKWAWWVLKFGISFWQLAAAYVIFVSTKPLFRRDAVGATIHSVILGGVLLKISAKKQTVFIYNTSLGSGCVICMYYFIDVVAYWSTLNRFMTQRIVMELNWDSWLWPSPVSSTKLLQGDDR